MRNSIIKVEMSGPAFTITQENYNAGDMVSSSQIHTGTSNGRFQHAPQVLSLVKGFLEARNVPHTLVLSAEAEANLGQDLVNDILHAVLATRLEEV